MANQPISFSVFTKPWKSLSVWELGKFVKDLGFDGVEFPLRDGYQLEPSNAHKLPELAKQFADHGLRIFSIASSTDERVFAGCAEAGIPMIRIMPSISHEFGYMESEKREREKLEALIPLCQKYGVKVGSQQHYGNHVTDSMGLLHLLDGLAPECVGAIWDSAHDALAGQQPEFGLDIVWPYLAMVNLKNAYYNRLNGPEAQNAEWKRYFTSGRQGLASWPRVANYLKQRDYNGVICLTAEYTNEHDVDRLIGEDIVYAKSLFE
ncbi:sugar phosphate isomerase/epimerase family protein [Paenibacillus silviterrae]|uniref:sugar phosphate isomerase/epimerase family protein n=1 Tax=Paenibacillus silviterrae TaxID=3242194 RepID=UPI0025430411|nr:sugar phosphate isomerase/epimerase family protein [Paenibacillus chinjuensis]